MLITSISIPIAALCISAGFDLVAVGQKIRFFRARCVVGTKIAKQQLIGVLEYLAGKAIY